MVGSKQSSTNKQLFQLSTTVIIHQINSIKDVKQAHASDNELWKPMKNLFIGQNHSEFHSKIHYGQNPYNPNLIQLQPLQHFVLTQEFSKQSKT